MENIIQTIQEKNAERVLNILKEFSEVQDALEKARSGVYADNAENRKLQRVGQKYGSDKKQDERTEKKTTKDDDSNNSSKINVEDKHKKFIDDIPEDEREEQLQNFLDKNPKPKDEETKKLVESAKKWISENSNSSTIFNIENKDELKKKYSKDLRKFEKDMFIDRFGDINAKDTNDDEFNKFLDERDYLLENVFSDNEKSEPKEKSKLHTKKDFKNGDDFFESFYDISDKSQENDLDWQDYLMDIQDYITDNNLGLDNKNQEKDFDELSDEHKSVLGYLMKKAIKKFESDSE